MKKISLYFNQKAIDSELVLKDKNVVVVDVLRTSTTIVTGLANGAKEIIPTEDVASAGLIGRNSEGHSLLCGERNGKVIEGFNLGNSVSEYNAEKVSGKTLIFNTTNGTAALMKSKFAQNCIILGFVNMSRVVDFLSHLNEDFIILCAGKSGEFALEDTVCAGMLIRLLISKNRGQQFELTDSALGSMKLYSSYKNSLEKMLHDSEHGKYLASIGFEEDLTECAKVDVHGCLAVLRQGVIKLIESFDSDPKLTMKKVGH